MNEWYQMNLCFFFPKTNKIEFYKKTVNNFKQLKEAACLILFYYIFSYSKEIKNKSSGKERPFQGYEQKHDSVLLVAKERD